jgi:hypothetical protein
MELLSIYPSPTPRVDPHTTLTLYISLEFRRIWKRTLMGCYCGFSFTRRGKVNSVAGSRPIDPSALPDLLTGLFLFLWVCLGYIQLPT